MVDLPPPELALPLTQPAHLTADELVRSGLAWAFAVIFAGTTAAATYLIFAFPQQWSTMKELLQIVLPAETGVLGSAVGFYFGSKK